MSSPPNIACVLNFAILAIYCTHVYNEILPIPGHGMYKLRDHLTRGCHFRKTCTKICDCGQNALTHLDRKFLLLHCICIKILGFSSDISLDLDQFYRKYQRDIVA